MSQKPAGLIYGVDDVPPLSALCLLAIQHIFLMSSTLVLPVVLVTELGGNFGQVQSVVALTMVACGIGTILQAMRWRGIGSGYLCPNLCGPNFFASSMSAAWLGGLPLMRGMTIAAGLVEMVFARYVHRLEFLFPTEITGLVVFMVAVSLVPVGASKFLHIDYTGEPIQVISLLVAAATFLAMAGLNIWGNAKLRLYGVLIGMVAGYALSAAAGLLPMAQFEQVAQAPWIGLPALDEMLDISFRWSLLPTFIIVSICGALKSFGNLVMCEKVNDDNWQRPDTRRIGHGLMADGILRGDFRSARRCRVRHVVEQRVTERRIGSDVAGDRLCRRRAVHSVGTVAEAQRAPVDHAAAGRGRDRRVRGVLHDDVRPANHAE